MKIDKKVLYDLYMTKINQISNDLDWKTAFSPKEIVNIISDILENNPSLIDHE